LYPRPIVAYLRVSTEKQDLESQWATIEAWAKARGVTIDERLVEVESGSEDERPVFQELWGESPSKEGGHNRCSRAVEAF